MGWGHRVTFNMNTSLTEVTKAYTSYMKNKKESGSLTKEGQAFWYLEQYYQVWDEYFWMTPEKGQLITPTTICWEQKEHKVGFGDHLLDPKELKYMGYLFPEQCKQIFEVTYHPNRSVQWPGSNWKYNPRIRWLAHNRTQWLCGLNLWPWLPVGWVGHCTLGFAFAHGCIKPSLHQPPVNLPYLHTRWTRSVFQWYDYLAALFVPSIGTTDIMVKVEALTNFTKQALLDSSKAIQALNKEQIQMRKSAIQNRMALDILTAAQEGTCTIIKAECCVYIPDLSGNVSTTLEDMQNQVKAMSNENIPFWTLVLSWVKGDWWKTIAAVVIIVLIILLCGPCLLQCLVNFVTQRLIVFSHVGSQRARVQYISINDARYRN